jgi:hypothetical protein
LILHYLPSFGLRLKLLLILVLLLAAATADVESNHGHQHQEYQDRLHRKGRLVVCRGFFSDWGGSHRFVVVFFEEEKTSMISHPSPAVEE